MLLVSKSTYPALLRRVLRWHSFAFDPMFDRLVFEQVTKYLHLVPRRFRDVLSAMSPVFESDVRIAVFDSLLNEFVRYAVEIDLEASVLFGTGAILRFARRSRSALLRRLRRFSYV